MKGPWFFLALFVAGSIGVEAAPSVDFSKVIVERRQGVDWCVLEAQVTGTVTAPFDKVRAVIEGYEAYPQLFPRIKEVQVVRMEGVVFLTEKVVVEAMGVVNTNRFTLRIMTSEPRDRTVQSSWTQETTDGTIDSLEGSWILEDRGTAQNPQVRVVYRTKSAVPVRIPGQDVVIGMFLGGETKAVVEAVFKKALSR